MASLLDLYQSSAPPQSWGMADINLQEATLGAEAGTQSARLKRNFTQYDLPDLMSNQAARGAFHSSATQRKASRLQTAHNESQEDITRQLGFRLSDLANRKVAVTTGGGF